VQLRPETGSLHPSAIEAAAHPLLISTLSLTDAFGHLSLQFGREDYDLRMESVDDIDRIHQIRKRDGVVAFNEHFPFCTPRQFGFQCLLKIFAAQSCAV
jgi:hypothetical protein